MARRGAGIMAQTDYSLDVRELRRRLKDAFLLLDGCGGEAASYAFDDFGRGAMVIDDSLQYAFGTDGKGYATYMQFPIEFTYTYVDGVLTISYSEEIQEGGKVTFFGDYEFTLETEDEDGNLTQETYYKQVSDS